MTAADVSFLMVGTPRSGTTLLQRLACELPGVGMPPETHFFDYVVHHWESVGREAAHSPTTASNVLFTVTS